MSDPKQNNDADARIENAGTGVGAPTQQMVEDRANELARLGGRNEASEDDMARASEELHNQNIELSTDESRSNISATQNPADMAVETGREIGHVQPLDEQELMEKEIKEGVREAEHEQMLRARQENDGPEV